MAVALLISLIGGYSSSAAFTLYPQRWDHACLTHDGNPDIVAALAKWAAVSGVRDCGFSNKPELYVVPLTVEREAWLSERFAAAAAFTIIDRPDTITRCEIVVRPEVGHDEWYWLHEVGHCLGMDHTDVSPAVMNPAQATGGKARQPQPDDIAAIRSLFGPPLAGRVAWVTGVGRD